MSDQTGTATQLRPANPSAATRRGRPTSRASDRCAASGGPLSITTRRVGVSSTSSTIEHQDNHLAGCKLILIMDVFEHAFMLDYGLKRADYSGAFFNVIKREAVESRLS